MPDRDREDTISRYTERYREHGYSPLTLGWKKGRQSLRFDVLTSEHGRKGASVLDLGCGFGDLNHTLEEKFGTDYRYHGVDLVEALITEGRSRWPDSRSTFTCGDFLALPFDKQFDFAVASGVFNHRLDGIDNYVLIEAFMDRALELCRDGFAFDFLSDKVDYPLGHTFHSSPERILAMAYSRSRNLILRNDYMPFEFSLFVFKDDGFDIEDAVFHRQKERPHGPEATK